ncbi:MAG: RNA 2'-phosphotransferase [Planctomycetota bacterium]
MDWTIADMSNDDQRIRTSKFLSKVLRHDPGRIGLSLDAQGWVDVDALLAACERSGRSISREWLTTVVESNDKQRFRFNDDGTRIRAVQGHSTTVNLGYSPLRPPDILYHGTIQAHLESIQANGLLKQSRHHVHLSLDVATARKVGARHEADRTSR